MDIWLLGLLHCASSLFYVDVPAVQVQFSPTIEHMYQLHNLKFTLAADAYEHEHNDSPAIIELFKEMRRKNLACLLKETEADITEIYKQQDVQGQFKKVQDQFQTAYDATKRDTGVDDRVKQWKKFLNSFYDIRQGARKKTLSHMWFPGKNEMPTEPYSLEKKFFEQNAKVMLDGVQRDVIADRVLEYMPFVLIERYDAESFQVFLDARDA